MYRHTEGRERHPININLNGGCPTGATKTGNGLTCTDIEPATLQKRPRPDSKFCHDRSVACFRTVMISFTVLRVIEARVIAHSAENTPYHRGRWRMISYDEWMKLTSVSLSRRGDTLKELDKCLDNYHKAHNSSTKQSTLQELSRVFEKYITKKGGMDQALLWKRNKKYGDNSQSPFERMQSGIREAKLANAATIRTLNGPIQDNFVIAADLRSQPVKGKQVEEAMNRSKLAVGYGYELASEASRRAGPARVSYERWFGAYDAGRIAIVKQNLKKLKTLLESGIVDCKDATNIPGAWGDCFGFAQRGLKQNWVEFSIGRAFFQKTGYNVAPGATAQQRSQAIQAAIAQSYTTTSDWKVGTIIHELGHATNDLPDVDFQAPSTYAVSPGGLTPPGWTQCSYPKIDLDLALAAPDLAVQNTDSYGQFCREALEAKRK